MSHPFALPIVFISLSQAAMVDHAAFSPKASQLDAEAQEKIMIVLMTTPIARESISVSQPSNLKTNTFVPLDSTTSARTMTTPNITLGVTLAVR